MTRLPSRAMRALCVVAATLALTVPQSVSASAKPEGLPPAQTQVCVFWWWPC